MEKYRELFSISNNADEKTIENRFSEIADLLLRKSVIRRHKVEYRIEEIEFYFYNQHHRDIITYPRNTAALQWFRNAFCGLDLTFESHINQVEEKKKLLYTFKGEPAFGGILIRIISKNGTPIKGPKICANELFGVLNATSKPNDHPILELRDERQIAINQFKRVNFPKKDDTEALVKKVNNILYYNWYYEEYSEDLKNDLNNFIDKPYRFTTQPK